MSLLARTLLFIREVLFGRESRMHECHRCGQVLPESEFYRLPSKKGTLATQCKSCLLAYKREHRARLSARELIPTPEGEKACPRCGVNKALAEGFHRDRGRPNGHMHICKECNIIQVRRFREKHHEVIKERKRQEYAADPKKYRDLRRKRVFGVGPADYERLLMEQDGVCAICRQPERTHNKWGPLKNLAVDHDHATGIMRGLLCAQCNKGIGNLGESIERLEAAATYLYRHRLALALEESA